MLTTVLTEAREEVLLEDEELHGEEEEIFKLEAIAEDIAEAPADDVASSSSLIASSNCDVPSCSTLLMRTVCSPTSSSLLPALHLVVDFQNLSGSTWCTGDSDPAAAAARDEVEGGGRITTVDVVDVVWFVLKSKADDEVGLLTLPII